MDNIIFISCIHTHTHIHRQHNVRLILYLIPELLDIILPLIVVVVCYHYTALRIL